MNEVKTNFDAAVAAEKVVPYMMTVQHPDMRFALAALVGVTEAEYDASTLAEEAYLADISETIAYEMNPASIHYGTIGTAFWAVLPFQTQITIIGGDDQPMRCKRLVVFGTQSQTYATVLADTRTQTAFDAAFRELAAMIAEVPHACG